LALVLGSAAAEAAFSAVLGGAASGDAFSVLAGAGSEAGFFPALDAAWLDAGGDGDGGVGLGWAAAVCCSAIRHRLHPTQRLMTAVDPVSARIARSRVAEGPIIQPKPAAQRRAS